MEGLLCFVRHPDCYCCRAGPPGACDAGAAVTAPPAHGGGLGDFVGLREYQGGDRVGSIHWPTSARLGAPVVVVHSAEATQRVVIRVADVRGAAWERELSRAAGQVLRGFSRGSPVGLELPEHRLEARTGAAWRRTLLDALARAPWRGNL